MKRLLSILMGLISRTTKQQREPEYLGYESYVPVSTFRSRPAEAPAAPEVEHRKAA